MYVRMYVCVYVCMRVCAYVCMYLCMIVHVGWWIRVHDMGGFVRVYMAVIQQIPARSLPQTLLYIPLKRLMIS